MRYVRESLLPDEKVISEASVHWWVFAPGAMLLFLGVMSLPRGPGVGVVLILIGAILAGKGYITRMSTELALTDKRIIAKFGLFNRNTVELIYRSVESFHVKQSILGRLFGYGTIVICGTGGGSAPIPMISSPIEFKSDVMMALQKSSPEAER